MQIAASSHPSDPPPEQPSASQGHCQHCVRRRPAGLAAMCGCPVREAAPVALQTVIEYLKTHIDTELAPFVLFALLAYQAYRVASGRSTQL